MTGDQVEGVLNQKPGLTFSQGISCTAAGAHEAIDMLSNMSRPLIADLAGSAHSVVEQATAVAASATRTLGISDDEFKDAQHRVLEATRRYVQLHPVATLGIAVVLGVAVSRMTSSS